MCSFFCHECSLIQSSRCLHDSAWRQPVLRTCGNSHRLSAIPYTTIRYPYEPTCYPVSPVRLPAICCLLAGYTIFDIGYRTIRPYDYTLIRLYAIQGCELNAKLIAYCLLLTAYCLLQGIPSGHGRTTLPPTPYPRIIYMRE